MVAQKTLAAPARLEGIGLHLGERVSVEILPAPEGSGVYFVRTDLPGHPRVGARLENLSSRPRRTALASGDAEIHTVEHLMASLWARDIHNAEVRVDGPELPGLDGSALPYYEALTAAGTVEQSAPAPEIELKRPVAIADEGASIVAVQEPGGGLSVSYTLDYGGTAGLATQFLSLELDEETFARDIAPARTFVLKEEALALQAAGLGKGANTQNTLVLDDGRILDNELRFEDEFVRHKILDLLGDLYLTGCRLRARVLATKSGHALNVRLARSLSENGVAERTPAPANRKMSSGAAVPEAEGPPVGYRGPLETTAIAQLLPHRYPFLLVDRLLEISEDRMSGRGLKNVTVNEEFFNGHFPGRPVMPGVLQIEAMAQFAGLVLLSHEENAERMAYLLSLDRVKFRRPVVPGDQLILEAKIRSMKLRSAEVEVRATVDGRLTTEALIRFVMAR